MQNPYVKHNGLRLHFVLALIRKKGYKINVLVKHFTGGEGSCC